MSAPDLKMMLPVCVVSSANVLISTVSSKVVLSALLIVKFTAFTVSLKLTAPAWSIITEGAVVSPTLPVNTALLCVGIFIVTE